MLKLVPSTQFSGGVQELFAPLFNHLAVVSTLEGLTPGAVYVDDAGSPAFGLIWFHSRVYLAGDPGASWAQLQDCFKKQLVPQMQASHLEGFVLHAQPIPTETQMATLLPDFYNGCYLRRHYTCRTLTRTAPQLPPGFRLRAVDRRLITASDLSGTEWLCEEMVSERASVDEFLQHSFGVALLFQNEIVGWCLSEYNCRKRCEVGVAVADTFQRRGLGAALTMALLKEAFARGYTEIGWHCWAENRASAALAEHCGFGLESEFPVGLWSLDQPENS